MKASMDEKMDILFSLKASIDNMRRIIDSAWTWCSIITEGGFRYDYIWDILNSDVTGEIAKDVINKWNQVLADETQLSDISQHFGDFAFVHTISIGTSGSI